MDIIDPAEDLILAQAHRLKGNVPAPMTGATAAGNYSNTLRALALHFDLKASKHLEIVQYALLAPAGQGCGALPTAPALRQLFLQL